MTRDFYDLSPIFIGSVITCTSSILKFKKYQEKMENMQFTREKVKRQLLDQLSDLFDFDVPPRMLESEFEQIWKQVQEAKDRDASDTEIMNIQVGVGFVNLWINYGKNDKTLKSTPLWQMLHQKESGIRKFN